MPEHAPLQADSSGDEAVPPPIRVLHVDDDSDFLAVTETFLERIDDEFTVVTAQRVTEARERLEREPVDCIVSDYLMPGGDGLEFLRTVRETHPDLPYVLFTGRGGEGVASDAISAGVTDYLPKQTGRDQFELLANRIRTLVERHRAEAELRDLRRRDERVARASADAFVDWKRADGSLWWSEGLRRTFGYQPGSTSRDLEWWRDRIHPDDCDRVAREICAALEAGEELVEFEYRFRRADDTYAEVVSRGYVTYEDGTPVCATGALIDVTDRKRHRRTLAALHDASRQLAQAERAVDVCEVAARTARDILELSTVGVYLWDGDDGVLRPAATTPDTDELLGEPPTFEPGESIAWEAFLDGETRVFDDVRTHENVYNEATPVRSELVVPLGEHGVFLSGSTDRDVFSETDVRLAETLAANTTAALDRAERERNLRETEQTLREKNERLRRLDRVNSIIRTVQRDVVGAQTRQEVERALCTDLLEADSVRFVWVGSEDDAGQLSAGSWAGDSGGFLDELLGDGDGTSLPAREAIETGEPVLTSRFRSRMDDQSWCREALARGFQSVLSVPLTDNGNRHGVVEIYTDRPDTFAGEDRDVLVEMCDFVANALNAIERRQALVAQSDVELEFRVRDVDDPLFRLARHADCTIDVDATVPQSGGEWLLYLSVDGCDPGPLSAVADQHVSLDRLTPVEGQQDAYEAAVSTFELATALGDHGATLRSLQAGPEDGSVVVRLPQSTDVSSFVAACPSVFSESELVRRNQLAPAVDTDGGTAVDDDRLTDRQRDVLEVAYRNGFFEWPREHTGEEIADRLDVSPPTFHRHVRVGTGKVLGSVLE